MAHSELLRMENVSKSFPGVKALDGVSLTVEAGSVHALMGENGAGKSTLMKCLFGVYAMDSGRVMLDGRAVDFGSSREALEHGVAMVHQELNQAERLTVAENMWLGRFPRALPHLPFISRKKMRRMTADIFKKLSVNIDPDAPCGSLSVSQRQMLEIARAASYGARLIVFDEPTSSLSEGEVERLFSIIEKLKGEGCGIIYISHKMAEILRICDTVTVMRDGRHIATRPAEELTTDEIIRLMVGRELTERYPPRESISGEVLLRADGLAGEHSRLREASFSLREGEILGVAGLDGSGRTELLEALFGMSRLKGGELTLRGEHIKNRTPAEAKRNGFALLTEERRRGGVFGILDVKENTTLASLRSYSTLSFISEEKRRAATDESMQSMRVKAASQRVKMRTLSGGNQQKIILGRWLLTSPEVLLLDEPTRGIDVLAKYEIYQLLIELKRQKKGIIMVSSEMPELLGVSDRIIVMSGGRIAGELDAATATQEKIMELAAKFA